MTQIQCSRCGKDSTVPFVPTPGRPVFCGPCHSAQVLKRREVKTRHIQPRRRMLAAGRKAHFVYDALEVVQADGGLDDARRRTFVEGVFARGSRQTAADAVAYIEEKRESELITGTEADGLVRLVEQYSMRR